MKREKERLERLRHLDWDDYIQTPEWKATERAAISRAGNRCQVCNGVSGLLACHRSYENVGCEQEQDLIVLCETCREALRGKTGEAEDSPEVFDEEEESQQVTFKERVAVFAPAAFAGLGLPALLHAPLPAELFGLGAAIALVIKRPQIYRDLRDNLPEPARDILDWVRERMRARGEEQEERREDSVDEEAITFISNTVDQLLEEPEKEQELSVARPTHLPKKLIELAQNLVIPASDLASKATFIAGMRRSGKTTLGVRIAEQMSQYDLPLLVPDLEGDWLSAAATTFKHGRILGHPSAARRYSDVPDFEAVTVENADVAGFNILDEGAQAVLDMASYPSIDEACQVVVNIIRGLFTWTEQYEDERVPCQVYLDEAQRFLPQSLDDSIIEDRLVRQALLRAYMDIIAVGGKRGLSPVILTQRFSQVNKKIMAQSEVFFLLRQTNDNDLKRCMEYVNSATATPEDISRFAQGEGIYIAATGEQQVTRFLPRQSSGKRGATPTIEAAERYAQRRAMRATVPMDRPEEEEPKVRVLYPVKSAGASQTAQEEEGKPRSVERVDLAKAFALWQAGGSSVRKLEAAAKAAGYSWSNGRCRALIEAMRENNLIPRESEEIV